MEGIHLAVCSEITSSDSFAKATARRTATIALRQSVRFTMPLWM
jgi:hypothetical protein